MSVYETAQAIESIAKFTNDKSIISKSTYNVKNKVFVIPCTSRSVPTIAKHDKTRVIRNSYIDHYESDGFEHLTTLILKIKLKLYLQL